MRILFFLLCSCLAFASGGSAGEPPADDGLVAALSATVNNHPAVRGKLAELAAQGYRIDTAKAGRYPNLSGQVSKLDGNEYGSLRLRQPLWAFGKIDTPIALTKAQLRVEQLGLLQVQRQLLEQTAAAYARVLGARRQLAVADENVAEHQKLYQRIQRRQAGQLASEADVRLAFSRLLQSQSQGERIASDLQLATAELQSLTQVEIGSEEPVRPVLLMLPTKATIESVAWKNHADVRFKKAQIQVAKYKVTLEKIASAPTLYAEVKHDFFDSSTSEATRAGLSLEGSLEGAGLAIIGRVKSASAQVEAARQDLRSTRNDVRLRVDNLLTSLSLQSRLKQSQQITVEAVRETRESFYRQYHSGRKTWLEVLNIQRELTEQRLQRAQADSDWLSLSLRLAALIGQLDAIAGLPPVAAQE